MGSNCFGWLISGVYSRQVSYPFMVIQMFDNVFIVFCRRVLTQYLRKQVSTWTVHLSTLLRPFYAPCVLFTFKSLLRLRRFYSISTNIYLFSTPNLKESAILRAVGQKTVIGYCASLFKSLNKVIVLYCIVFSDSRSPYDEDFDREDFMNKSQVSNNYRAGLYIFWLNANWFALKQSY